MGHTLFFKGWYPTKLTAGLLTISRLRSSKISNPKQIASPTKCNRNRLNNAILIKNNCIKFVASIYFFLPQCVGKIYTYFKIAN